jgi:hypothetical protein
MYQEPTTNRISKHRADVIESHLKTPKVCSHSLDHHPPPSAVPVGSGSGVSEGSGSVGSGVAVGRGSGVSVGSGSVGSGVAVGRGSGVSVGSGSVGSGVAVGRGFGVFVGGILVGKGVAVGAGVSVGGTFVGRGVAVGAGVFVGGTFVGRGVAVGAGVSVGSGSVGSGVAVGAGVSVGASVSSGSKVGNVGKASSAIGVGTITGVDGGRSGFTLVNQPGWRATVSPSEVTSTRPVQTATWVVPSSSTVTSNAVPRTVVTAVGVLTSKRAAGLRSGCTRLRVRPRC